MSADPSTRTLPDGWKSATIGDVCKVVSGSTPKTSVSDYWGGAIPWLTPNDLSKNRSKVVFKGERSITQKGFDSCSTQMVPEGSVLFTSRAPIGYVAITGAPVCTNQGFKSAVPSEGIGTEFLYWQLQNLTDDIRSRASGTTFLEISGKGFASTRVVVPPLREQEKIVEIVEEQLSRLDAALASVNAVRKKAARFRRSLLHTAFNGSLTGQDTSTGTLPEGWELKELRELVDVLDSMRKPINSKERLDRTGTVPYFGATGQVGTIDKALFDEDLVLLGEDGVQFFDADKQKAYEISGPSWVNNHAHVLRCRKEKYIQRLLVCYLNQFDYRNYANGTTRLKLTQAAMNRIPVVVPPFNVQVKIVEVLEEQLSRLDASLVVADAIEKKASALRRSLLHAAFTGELTKEWREGIYV